MVGLPLAYLKHTITIEPFTGVPAAPKGAATTSKCLITFASRKGGASAGTGTGTPGADQPDSAMIIAPLTTVCPPGSKITLPDGRVGHAAGVTRNEAGGLPTPDHLEIRWAPGWTTSQANEFE